MNILIGFPLSKAEGTSWYVVVISIPSRKERTKPGGSIGSHVVHHERFQSSTSKFTPASPFFSPPWPTHDLESVRMYQQISTRSGSQSQDP